MTTSGPATFPAADVWEMLDPRAAWPGDWHRFRHRDLGVFLHGLIKVAPFSFNPSQAGCSVEYRGLQTLRFGTPGGRRVLAWTRQHGDEPDCQAALCMVLHLMATRSSEEPFRTILANTELLVMPMVNPDGVERFTRRSAVGIDLNRDAVALATPEAQTLYKLKDEFKPEYAFNLHDMSARKSTADGDLVAIAFQAGPFDRTDSDNTVRLKAKQIIGHMAATARIHAPTNIAKYTANYMHRAFGDSMMRWGVSSILIESGGWFDEKGGDDFVRRLHALALLSGLHSIATGGDASPTGAAYEAIPFDGGAAFSDVIISGGKVLDGGAHPLFQGDVAFNGDRRFRRAGDVGEYISAIDSIGDLVDSPAKLRLERPGTIVMPGVTAILHDHLPGGNLPGESQCLDWLRAGVTTVIAGVGPFASPIDAVRVADSMRDVQPHINMVPFEQVESLSDIVKRHGMSVFAGLLVRGLSLMPQELIDFIHLYHPAHHSAVQPSEQDTPVGVCVLFRGGASPRSSAMHLCLHPVCEGEKCAHDPGLARNLATIASELLYKPDQITFSRAGLNPLPDFLPIVMSPVGLEAEPPPRDLIPRIIHRFSKGDEGSVAAIAYLWSAQMARALRLGGSGEIRMGNRADIVAFAPSIMNPQPEAHLEPELVVMNGQIVIDKQRGIEKTGRGVCVL